MQRDKLLGLLAGAGKSPATNARNRWDLRKPLSENEQVARELGIPVSQIEDQDFRANNDFATQALYRNSIPKPKMPAPMNVPAQSGYSQAEKDAMMSQYHARDRMQAQDRQDAIDLKNFRLNQGNQAPQTPQTPQSDSDGFSFSGLMDSAGGMLSGLRKGAHNLFNDPTRMALLQGGLTAMNPNSYYDKDGFYSTAGGINRALGTAGNTYQNIVKPQRDQAFKMKQIGLQNQRSDPRTGYQKDYQYEVLNQGYKKSFSEYVQERELAKKPQNSTVATGEGVFRNPPSGGPLGERLGSPPPAFGYNPMDYQQQGEREVSPSLAWVPKALSSPFDGVPIRQQGPMMQAEYLRTNNLLETQRVNKLKAETASDALMRFGYLNSQQETGSWVDRMTRFSIDKQKIEMDKLQDRLTPSMRDGLPGAASDRDVAMFANATVSIQNPKEINDAVIKGAMKLNQNKIDRYNFLVAYRERNGHLQGADFLWQQYVDANPIFDPTLPEGSYVLNPARRTMQEYFKNPNAPQTNRRKSDVKKDRRKEDKKWPVERVN